MLNAAIVAWAGGASGSCRPRRARPSSGSRAGDARARACARLAAAGLRIGRPTRRAGGSRDPGGGAGDAPYAPSRQVEAAAAARKPPVYCEKPSRSPGGRAGDAGRLCAAGVTVGVGHHFRLMPSLTALRAEIGSLAPSCTREGNYSHDWLAAQPADSWRSAAEETAPAA